MFGGLVVVLTRRWSLVQTCLFRNIEVQQKESRKGFFFPAGTFSQSPAGLLLKLQGLPHDLLCSFFPSLIRSSLTQCLFPTSAAGPQGKYLCQHDLAADPALNAVLKVWGSSSSCSDEWSMNTPNFFSHPGSMKDSNISVSLPYSHRVTDSHGTGNEIHIFWVKICSCKTLFLASARAFYKACRSISSWNFSKQTGQKRYNLFLVERRIFEGCCISFD